MTDQVEIDVFNGDADGICARQQFRLYHPNLSQLLTGVKRDIQLLEKLNQISNSSINVFDISFDSNLSGLKRLLENGNRITYFDHHAATQRFEHSLLKFHWDQASNTCTSLLVCDYTQAKYSDWALVGCYGDSLDHVADKLAETWCKNPILLSQYRELGRLLNYNAYGDTLSDLHFAPNELADQIQHYQTVQDFLYSSEVFSVLQQGYADDMRILSEIQPEFLNERVCLYILPDTASARRLSGSLANQIQLKHKQRSVALLSHTQGGYRISIRSASPEMNPAARFAQEFTTGGGRASAAGINLLLMTEVDDFSRRFIEYFSQV